MCLCALYYCHRVATQLQLNISYNTYAPQPALASNCYCVKLCELASSLTIYIIASLISTSFFSFKFTDLAVSHSVSWNCLCLKSLQDLQVKFVGSCFWCLDLHVFASAALNFLAALQLFALWVESEFKSWIITSPDQFGTHSTP